MALAALTTVTVFAQNPKFAHVSFSELVQLMPAADTARNQMAAASKEAQETLSSMMEEFQNKYQQYQSKSASWTAAIRETKEKELGEIQNRVQEFQQNVQQELQMQEQQLMAPIHKRAVEAVTRLAKEGGYIYVFEKGSLLYVDEAQSTDLTPAARRLLNIPEGRTMESLQAELQAKAQAEAAK